MSQDIAAAPPRPGTKAAMAVEIATLRADITKLVDGIYLEAQRRGWCSDYEWWVRHTNPTLSRAWLKPRRGATNCCDICGLDHHRHTR